MPTTTEYATDVWPNDYSFDEQAKSAAPDERRSIRALFISDVHLGTRACQAELLTQFLHNYDVQTIYLVGDILESKCLKSKRRWSMRQNVVIHELLERARQGTRIIYIPGNHDYQLRRCAGKTFLGIEIKRDAIHESADGRKYLVTHGDQYDVVMRHMPWLANIGHGVYHALLTLNASLNVLRRSLGLNYWSLSQWSKHNVKRVVTHMSHFEQSLLNEAREKGAQGVICGHIHHAADHDIDGMRYLNSGDWVETCSGIVEYLDGRFELVQWDFTQYPAHHKATLRTGQPLQPYDVGEEHAGLDAVRNFQLRIRSAVHSRIS
ncbi:UDP-2,3-diacylglucosamine diphosphatase [Celerinatantimonas yamalensis]|uniref:UDP-2,3-diacylglucosamine diphosphatase n=1 Tax=Celerinatantimonas yamalensis TaxID=559956 RepID=A0ABW9G8Y0_9GAMM